MALQPEGAQHAAEIYAQADRIYTPEEVDAALERMARAITAGLGDTCPVVICLMVGGLMVGAKLIERLDFLMHVDYVHATRYRDTTRGGGLEWIARPRTPLQGRTVLVIDDILDEGHTLAAILEDCRRAGARRVYSAVLVEKLHARKHGVRPDFTGLAVADRYVFGSGMDYRGYLRNVQGIYAVKDDA